MLLTDVIKVFSGLKDKGIVQSKDWKVFELEFNKVVGVQNDIFGMDNPLYENLKGLAFS